MGNNIAVFQYPKRLHSRSQESKIQTLVRVSNFLDSLHRSEIKNELERVYVRHADFSLCAEARSSSVQVSLIF